ncbi:serine/threonine protein kinase [Nocardiopsis sp. Huas11]|uniref:serine/threonine protein kinase n=1 Tax=Nocardiopsis sp. Huas11 TaxID=2183912 RepID=UPI000EB1E46D|nr:serine/threonine-protein kinase [Nocardiopsis sp. Huas11]RKS05874.1 serine/threonine protein kinase [Nocardiopsis sp. Huas11]
MDAGVDDVGGYRLIRELGRGGFGSVHLARAPGGGLAAVKLLHLAPDTDPRFAQMFAREVEAARRVSPFCVAQVLDADPHAARPWIATEYIEGRTLAEEIDSEGPRGDGALQRLAVSTATALSAIHGAGVVHRDFKPENIMLGPDGPRVIDFGIARAFEETAGFTATSRIGTLHYMAPEQLEDAARLTPALDVFAWGAVMIYAASGRHAFAGHSQTAVIKKILMDEPDGSAVPSHLRELVLRCLEKAPERRPSAHQILDTLLGRPGHGTAAEAAVEAEETEDAVATRIVTPEGTLLQPTLRETLRPQVGAPVASPADSGTPAAPEQDRTPARERSGAPLRSDAPASPEPVPPFTFAGRFHDRSDTLAEAMWANPRAAAEVFADPDERAALAAWVIEDLRDARIDRGLFRRRPADADLAVARFIAQVRPDLPPAYKGRELPLSALREAAERTPDAMDSGLDVSLEVLEVMAEHGCQDAAHTCGAGSGCDEYRRLAETVRSALGVYLTASAPYVSWLSDPDGVGDRIGEEVAETPFVLAALAPRAWSENVQRHRARVPTLWRSTLPEVPPATAPLAERIGRAMVIPVFAPALHALADRGRELEGEKRRLQDYANRERARSRGQNFGGYLGAAAAAVLLITVAGGGLVSFDWPRFWWGLVLAVVAYFGVFALVHHLVLKEAEVPSEGEGKDLYPAVEGAAEKADRADAAAAELGRETRRLHALRSRAPRPGTR